MQLGATPLMRAASMPNTKSGVTAEQYAQVVDLLLAAKANVDAIDTVSSPQVFNMSVVLRIVNPR